MAKKEAKEEKAERAPRASVWGEGDTPNKSTVASLVKEYNAREGRKTVAGLARFAAEKDVSAEGLMSLAEKALEKSLELEEAQRHRRAALRAINGGAKVKRKAKAEAEEDAPAPKAKKGKKGKKTGKAKKAA